MVDRRDAKGVIGSVRQSKVEWSRVECRRRKVVAWGGGRGMCRTVGDRRSEVKCEYIK